MARRHLSLAVCFAVAAVTVGAQSKEKDQNKEQERLAASGVVINEVLDVPDKFRRRFWTTRSASSSFRQ